MPKFPTFLNTSFSGSFKGPLSARRNQRSFGKGLFGGGFSTRFTLDVAKSYFFTARDWTDILKPAVIKGLEWCGGIVKKRAKWDTSRRRKHAAPAGKPPRKLTGLLTKHIYYAVDPMAGPACIVGPVYFPRPHKKVYTFPEPTIPATLEFGGRERVGYARFFSRGNVMLPKNSVVTIGEHGYMWRAALKTKQLQANAWKNILDNTPASYAIADAKARAVA